MIDTSTPPPLLVTRHEWCTCRHCRCAHAGGFAGCLHRACRCQRYTWAGRGADTVEGHPKTRRGKLPRGELP